MMCSLGALALACCDCCDMMMIVKERERGRQNAWDGWWKATFFMIKKALGGREHLYC